MGGLNANQFHQWSEGAKGRRESEEMSTGEEDQSLGKGARKAELRGETAGGCGMGWRGRK